MSDTITPMPRISPTSAVGGLLEVLKVLANDGSTENFFSSLTFTEAAAMADLLHSFGKSDEAGRFMAQWASNDDEWEERNEDGDVDAWLALVPADEAEMWLSGVMLRNDQACDCPPESLTYGYHVRSPHATEYYSTKIAGVEV